MSQVSEIIVKWTPITSGRAREIQIQSRIIGTDQWTPQGERVDPALGELRFQSNAPSTHVEVRCRVVSTDNIPGDWFSADITTAPAVVEYDTVTGAPKTLAELDPPARDLLDGSWKEAQDASAAADVADQKAVVADGKATVADGKAQTAVDALKNNAGVIVPVRDLLVSERATTDTAVADAKKVGTDAQAAVAQARTDLGQEVAGVRADVGSARQDISTVRGEVAKAQTDANTARTDLAAEVTRAKGDEAAIRSTVASVKQTADNAAASISDEVTVRANADSALSNRARDLEATVFNGPNQNTTLSSRITDEETVRANADSAIASRATKLEAGYSGLSKVVPNDHFDNGVEGWTGFDANNIVVAASAGRSNVLRTAPGVAVNGIVGRKVAVSSPDQRFKLKASWRCAVAGAVYYFGAVFYDENNNHVGASDGTGNYPLGAGIYVNSAIDSGWINREVVIGKGVTEGSPYGGTRTIPAGAVYFRPIVFLNYLGEANSVTELDYFVIEEVTDIVATKALVTEETTARANADSALATRATTLETSVNNGATGNLALQGKISDEATTRSNADGALSGRISTTEAKLNGDQDSTLAARIRDTDTASVNRDSALTNRTTTLESRASSLTDEANKRFPGFERKFEVWGWDVQNGGRNGGGAAWETGHVKGAGVSFPPGMGSWLYMDPAAWIKTAPGKRYRAGFWVYQWSAPNGYGGNARVYWEGTNENHSSNSYLGATSTSPEATDGFYQPIPNGGWHCYASDLLVDDAITANADSYWVRPRINIDNIPANSGYVIAGWFFREVTDGFDNAAKITEEATTRANHDSALATRATNLETSVNNGATGNLALQGKISDEATTRSNTDSALATRATTLEAAATNTGNLVPNTAFVTLDGWFLTAGGGNGAFIEKNRAGPPYQIGGIENNLCLYQLVGGDGLQAEAMSERFAVRGGEYYQIQALVAAHRCRGWVSMFFLDPQGGFVGYAGENFGAGGAGQSINSHEIVGAKCVRAPDGAVSARVVFRSYDISNDGYVWFSRPYVGVVKANTDQWNAYSPGADLPVLVQTNARITEESTARANADSALVTRANNLEATVFNGPNQNSTLSSRISDEVTARSNAYDALANRSSSLESKMEGSAASGLQTLIKSNRKNLIDTGWWKRGASIPWPLNGGQRNEIVEFPHGGNFEGLPLPDGSSGDAWLCQADAGGQHAGGWTGAPIAVALDPDKTYRFTVPIAQLGGEVGRVSYWGTNGVCDLNTTNENGNPYFAIQGNMTLNRWHLFVGFIFPRNSIGKTHDGAGVWDMVTGEKTAGGTNYCFRPDGAQPLHRAYQFYSVNGAYQAFGRPMIELVDGTETPFPATFAAKRSVNAANARIANEETTRANAVSALANRSSLLESAASSAANTLNPNPTFTMWPEGQELPNGLSWWSKGSATVARTTSTLGRSGYGMDVTSFDGEETGTGWGGIYNTPGWYVMEADVWKLSGPWEGSGLTLGGVYSLDFLRDPDTNGVIGEVTYGGVRRFTKLINFTDQGYRTFHPMNNWSGFSGNHRAKSLRWLRAAIRPATAGEILAQKADGTANTAIGRIADEATTRANADSALASRTSVVEAQVSNDSNNLVRNAIFNQPGWGRGSVGAPMSWSVWAQENGGYIGWTDRPSKYGAACPVQIDRQGDQSGLTQGIVGPVAAGWYVIEADVDFESGNHAGAGVHVQFNNGYARNLSFGTEADTNGAIGSFGDVNRKFSCLFYNGANSNGVQLYLMAGWTGFTGTSNAYGFLRTIWHKVIFRPATAGEIAAQKVQDANVIARVTSAEGAIATIDGKTQAYFEKKASVPGADAFISAVAKNDNGVATSNVAIGGTSIALYNTESNTAKRAMFLGGGQAVFDGSITANGGILVGTGKLKVQVQAQDYAVSHDQYVSYGYDLGRAPTITFGPCPVALNNGEVYAPYAAELSASGFRAKLLINAAPQSAAQSTGGFANQGNNVWQTGKGGRPLSANGSYTVTVNLSAVAASYRDSDDYR